MFQTILKLLPRDEILTKLDARQRQIMRILYSSSNLIIPLHIGVATGFIIVVFCASRKANFVLAGFMLAAAFYQCLISGTYGMLIYTFLAATPYLASNKIEKSNILAWLRLFRPLSLQKQDQFTLDPYAIAPQLTPQPMRKEPSLQPQRQGYVSPFHQNS